MQKRMQRVYSFASDGYIQLKGVLQEHLDDLLYRAQRYQIHYTVALFAGYSKNADIKKHIRSSDRFIPISKEIALVIFDATPLNGGIKAAAKLTEILQAEDFNKHFYVVCVSSHEHDDFSDQATHLLNVLLFEIEHEIYNTPLSSSDPLVDTQLI